MTSITTSVQRRPRLVEPVSSLTNHLTDNPFLVLGGIMVLLFLAVELVGPVVTGFNPMEQNLSIARELPSFIHPFGTDQLGRDMLARVIEGGRYTIWISVQVLCFALIVGVPLGLLGGYYGGRLDALLMALLSVQLAFPGLVLALVLIGVMGISLRTLVVVTTIYAYPSFALLTRAQTLRTKQEEYITSARCLGATDGRIIFRHVLPNVAPHVMTLATLTLGRVVLTASSLGFLGVGVQAGTPEWGSMVAQARDVLRTYPHILFFPAAAITYVVVAFNLLGDGLRDHFDPHIQRRVR